MAQFSNLSEENAELIQKISEELGLYNYVRIEGIGKVKDKQLIKVQLDNPVTKWKTNKPDTVNIFIYEHAFDMLEDKQKEILIRDAFNQIHFDTEKDKITIGCPHIEVSIDGRAKWGEELLNAAEAGVHAIIQIEEEEKEEKERQKAERAAKRKSK